MEDEKIIKNTKSETDQQIPKYSVVPMWWTDSEECEIPTNEIIYSFNNVINKSYLNFVDLQGRLWVIEEGKAVIIINSPDGEDLVYLERLRKESKNLNLLKSAKKTTERDIYN